MRKTKYYTGKPIGSFKHGDKHPNQALWLVGYMGKYEKWVRRDVYERSVRHKERIAIAKARRAKIKRRPRLGTGNKVGTYKRGDLHPTREGYVFMQYKKGAEYWTKTDSKEFLAWKRGQKTKRVYPNILRIERWQGEVASHRMQEIAYAKMWRDWWTKIYKQKPKPSKEELAERKRENKKRERARRRAKYPAERAVKRKNRRHKLKKDWQELSEYEKRLANDIYRFRDILNKQQGHVVYVVDHIHPVAKGGMHHPFNLQVATYEWNEKKSDKIAV